MNRTVYRHNIKESGDHHFLKINPKGDMMEIIIHARDNIGGQKVTIFNLGPLNPINEKLFIKHWPVLYKADWVKAVNQVKSQLKKA